MKWVGTFPDGRHEQNPIVVVMKLTVNVDNVPIIMNITHNMKASKEWYMIK